jgi:hypothetical protein
MAALRPRRRLISKYASASIDQGDGKRRRLVIAEGFIRPQSCSVVVFDELLLRAN